MHTVATTLTARASTAAYGISEPDSRLANPNYLSPGAAVELMRLVCALLQSVKELVHVLNAAVQGARGALSHHAHAEKLSR